ncbi:hypothetical protein [Sedimenticola sp.]|uniref:hypothetical protein n=1 Tax=Sedimenticola sp. TaxID=1940285 RepID=UPI003D11C835
MKLTKILPQLCTAAFALALAACGGGGSGGDSNSTNTGSVQGLSLPSTVSVVAAQDESAAPAPSKFAQALQLLPAAFNDAGTDYSNAEQRVWVYESALQPLEQVNTILCYVDQTRASDFPNDTYIALIDPEPCEERGNDSGGGQTAASGGNNAAAGSSQDVQQYERWIVQSSRADNNSPQIVKLWIPNQEDMGNGLQMGMILVNVVINEGESDTNPFGDFQLDFAGIGIDTNTSTTFTMMRGVLKTVANANNKPAFKYIELSGNEMPGFSSLPFGRSAASAVIMDDANGTGGIAQVSSSENFDDGINPLFLEESNIVLNYNTGYFLGGVDNNNDLTVDSLKCKSRTAFDTQVWRYGLFHDADGSKVALNSGFPIRYVDGNNNGQYGFASYWGIWFDGQSNPAALDEQTVTRETYDGSPGQSYTIKASTGKAMKRKAELLPLANLDGENFQAWFNHPTLGDPMTNTTGNSYDSWIINISGGTLTIIGGITWGQNGPPIEDLTVPDTTITFNFDGEQIWMWSDLLQGSVVYTWDSTVAPTTVTLYSDETVFPGDATEFGSGPITLFCYDRCLKGGVTQNAIDTAIDESVLFYTTDGTEYTYTLTSTGGRLILTDNNGAAPAAVDFSTLDLTTNLTAIPDWYQWGISSGEMVIAANKPALGEWWKIWEAPESYRWESGTNEWNILIVLADGVGNAVKFDKPLIIPYTHTTANDRNGDSAFDNKPLRLEYGGNGELWGFPWVYNQEFDRWYSAVTLNDGVQLTDADGNAYRVKALDMEQTMQDTGDTNICTVTEGLSVTGLFSNTDLSLLTASDIDSGAITHSVADMPQLDEAPSVVAGEIPE